MLNACVPSLLILFFFSHPFAYFFVLVLLLSTSLHPHTPTIKMFYHLFFTNTLHKKRKKIIRSPFGFWFFILPNRNCMIYIISMCVLYFFILLSLFCLLFCTFFDESYQLILFYICRTKSESESGLPEAAWRGEGRRRFDQRDARTTSPWRRSWRWGCRRRWTPAYDPRWIHAIFGKLRNKANEFSLR